MSLSTAIFQSVNINGYLNVLYDSSLNGNVLIKSRQNSGNSTTGALVVNGGAGFNGNVWINGNIFATNLNSNNNWTSQSLGTNLPSNTYYLLASMGDFSNNYGSINITGTIGSQTGSNMSTINATIITSGNVAIPTIIGTINNYSGNSLCDIVIYYDNSSNNYSSNVKVTDISGFIYDSSNIFYNASNALLNINRIITGPGISGNTLIGNINTNAFSINTSKNDLSITSVNSTSIGLILNTSTFIVGTASIPLKYFVTASATAFTPITTANFNKPFINSQSSYSYTMANTSIFTTDPSIITGIYGFVINRSGSPYFVTGSTLYNNKILYNVSTVTNAPQLTGSQYTYSLSNANSNTTLTSFYGYYSGSTLKTSTLLVNGYLITDNNNGTGFSDGTTVNTVTNYTTTLTSPGTIPTTTATSVSGAVRLYGGTYYFVYPFGGTDPGVTSFITSASSPTIPDASAIFLNTKVSGGNNYTLGPAANLNSTSLSTSRFGLSGERVPYYIVDVSTIALPLRDSNNVIGVFNTTSNAVGGDIVTFAGITTQGRYDGYTLTASGDYLADASNCRHYIKVNNASFTADASGASATITTASSYAKGATITIGGRVGTVAAGQFISVPAIAVYNKSSIRVTATNGTTTINLDASLNTTGFAATPIHFYNPVTSLNILPPTTFSLYPGTQLYYSSTTFSLYNPVTFNFYQPQNYSLYTIVDLSDGTGPPPQYQIYLYTKQGGNGYFNLAITGDTSTNVIYPFTSNQSTPISGTKNVIPSICDSLATINNTIKTTFNVISSIILDDITNTTTYSGTSAPPYTTTSDGINIIMNTGINTCYFSISDSNLLAGSSIQITIQCSTNQIGINNNLYFGIGYSSSSPLFISPYLSIASITYIATITIPTTITGILYFYVYANAVSSGTQNIMYVANISISQMDIYSYGQFGIGKQNPQYSLDVSDNIRSNKILIGSNSIYTGISGVTNNNRDVVLFCDGSAGGGWVRFRPWGEQSQTNEMWYTTDGQLNATAFNAISDYRIKSNVKPIPSEYTIDLLQPIHYDISGGEGHDMGFIAHEVKKIFPFLVSGEKDGAILQSLNYTGFIALLVKEIQDLKKEIKILKEK
jgi:Chaperone of endosialidase